MPGQYAINPVEHTLSPIVTGSSVIAVKYDGGVLIAADTLASYGSQARYKDFNRIRKVGQFSLLGASGEMSDFQYLGKMIDELDEDDWLNQDGCNMGPKQYASYNGRVMYNKRSKMNPFYNSLVMVGKKGDDTPLLASIDHQGTYFEEDYVATGFGAHLATPIMRNEWSPKITKAEATAIIVKCLQLCFYRDCRAFNQYTLGCCDGKTTQIEGPIVLDHFWDNEAWTAKSLTGSGARATVDTW